MKIDKDFKKAILFAISTVPVTLMWKGLTELLPEYNPLIYIAAAIISMYLLYEFGWRTS